MAHKANKIFVPPSFDTEGVLFPVYFKPAPGRVVVCRYPVNNKIKLGEIDWYLGDEEAGKWGTADAGIVARFTPRLGDDGKPWPNCAHDLDLQEGMVVLMKPYTGNWYGHENFDWIPPGREVCILGTVEDWGENILAAVELEDAA